MDRGLNRCKMWIYGAAWGCACVTVLLGTILNPSLAILVAAVTVITRLASRRWFQETVLCLHTIVYWLPAMLSGIGHHRFHMAFVPWMIALLTVLGQRRVLRRWHMPLSWQWPVVGWAAIVALSWPIGVCRELHFVLPGEALGRAVNNIRGLSALTAAFWVARTALMYLVAVLWLDTLFGDLRSTTAHTRTGLTYRILRALQWGWIGVIIVAALQAFVDIHLLNSAYWVRQLRVSGALRDANALGTLAATWILLPRMHNVEPGHRWFRIAWLSTGLWAVLISGSRSALLMLGIGIISWSVCAGFRRRNAGRSPRIRSSSVVQWIGVMCAGALAMLFIPSGINTGWRRIVMIARAVQATGGPAVLWAQLGERPVFWKAALAVFLDAPLTGIGPGGVDIVLADYAWRHGWGNRILPFESALNGYIHFFAEYGLLGGIYLGIALYTFWKYRRARGRRGAVHTPWTALGLAWAVSLCFGVHIQHPAVLWTLLPLIAVWARQEKILETAPTPVFPESRTPYRVMGIAVLYAVLLLYASVSVYFPGLRPR